MVFSDYFFNGGGWKFDQKSKYYLRRSKHEKD